MSRSVSAEHVNGESFEGLLERLTRRLDSAGTHADLDAGFGADFDAQTDFGLTSFPETGSPASPIARRRTLAPVAEAKTHKARSGKPGADNMPLSYEMALRLHARRRPAGDGVAADRVAPDNMKTDVRNPVHATARSSSPDLSRRGSGPVSALNAKPSVQPKSKLNSKPGAKPKSKPGVQDGQKLALKLVQAGIDSKGKQRSEGRAGPRADSRVGSRGSSTIQASAGTPGRVSGRSRPAEIQDGKRGKSPHAAEARLSTNKPPAGHRQSLENKAPSRELQLDVAQRTMALERRQSIVSIRLTDSEIERLRQRAAESGISVSAYMRSCVLDAEHLRAQVKQALAEMRGSMPGPISGSMLGSMRPREEAQLPNLLPALSSESGSGQAAAWSRMLWKSATFFLGLWFPFRHRV